MSLKKRELITFAFSKCFLGNLVGLFRLDIVKRKKKNKKEEEKRREKKRVTSSHSFVSLRGIYLSLLEIN